MKHHGPVQLVRRGYEQVHKMCVCVFVCVYVCVCVCAMLCPLISYTRLLGSCFLLQHGDCFRLKLGTQGVTFLIGPDAHKWYFSISDKEFTQKEVYGFTVPGMLARYCNTAVSALVLTMCLR